MPRPDVLWSATSRCDRLPPLPVSFSGSGAAIGPEAVQRVVRKAEFGHPRMSTGFHFPRQYQERLYESYAGVHPISAAKVST